MSYHCKWQLGCWTWPLQPLAGSGLRQIRGYFVSQCRIYCMNRLAIGYTYIWYHALSFSGISSLICFHESIKIVSQTLISWLNSWREAITLELATKGDGGRTFGCWWMSIKIYCITWSTCAGWDLIGQAPEKKWWNWKKKKKKNSVSKWDRLHPVVRSRFSCKWIKMLLDIFASLLFPAQRF